MVAPTKSKKLKTESTHRCSGKKWKIMGTWGRRLCSYPKATPGSSQKTLIKFPFVEEDIGSQDRKRKWTTPAVGGLFPRASDSAKEANGLPQTSPKRHLGWLRLTEGGERERRECFRWRQHLMRLFPANPLVNTWWDEFPQYFTAFVFNCGMNSFLSMKVPCLLEGKKNQPLQGYNN